LEELLKQKLELKITSQMLGDQDQKNLLLYNK